MDLAEITETAAICAGLAHPTRLEILEILRDTPSMTLAALGERLREHGTDIKSRNLQFTTLQFHLERLRRAGIVEMHHADGYLSVTLERDVEFTITRLDAGDRALLASLSRISKSN